jgi:CRP-like cAMP-binding protein
LLDALPEKELHEVRPLLEKISLEIGQPLFGQGERIDHVHFPLSSVISLLTTMGNGEAFEAATVGNEGMVGVAVFLGAASTGAHMALCQIPGASLRIETEAFRAALDNGGTLRDRVQGYTRVLFVLLVQNSACGKHHPVAARTARALLMTHDRIGADTFPLTQEFLSRMLGVRRATVNTAARVLQEAGFIRYRRGRITILDREGLETLSCECYRVIKGEFDRLTVGRANASFGSASDRLYRG